MKCKVCGAESGKYPLCRSCNMKKEKGEIIKCPRCNNWHYDNAPCPINIDTPNEKYLYEVKERLISKSEQSFFHAIEASVPDGYFVFPQINLAAFIVKTDATRFQNELFRNVDFLITDSDYCPKIIIEINDQSHLTNERKERDEKVRKICEEAGIPILKLWTSYGVNQEYIRERISEVLNGPLIARVHHFRQTVAPEQSLNNQPANSSPSNVDQAKPSDKKKGCYIATCVYGSYDCPQVWTLRRYRDSVLFATWHGQIFIHIYYAISPTLVKWFGETKWFKKIWRKRLDRMVKRLNEQGLKDTPYRDQ